MATQFTDAERKKLAELLEKQRKVKQEARNEAKRNDRTCQKLFGMSVKEVRAALDAGQREPEKDWWPEYHELRCKVERLMQTAGKQYSPEEFERYVSWVEQKKAAKNV